VTLARRLARKTGYLLDKLWIALHAPARIEDTVYLVGSPRSGTTWLLEVLEESLPGYRSLHEPLSRTFSPYARRIVEELGVRGPPHLFYQPHTIDNPRLDQVLETVLTGRVPVEAPGKPRKLLAKIRRLTAPNLIVKDVVTSPLAPYTARRFPLRALIVLVRHPAAVVDSQIRMWNRYYGGPPSTERKRLILENLAALAGEMVEYEGDPSWIRGLETVEEMWAAMWALNYLPPLRHQHQQQYKIVYYEHLAHSPDNLANLIKTLGAQPPENIEELAARPSGSTITTPGSRQKLLHGWKDRLPRDKIHRIMEVVYRIGIDIYTPDTPEPRV